MLVKILLSIGLLAAPLTAAFPLDTTTADSSASPVDASPAAQKDADTPAANPDAATIDAAASEKTATATETATGVDTAIGTETVAKPAESQTWILRYKFLPGQQLRYKNTESVTLDAMQGELRKVDVTSFEQRRVFTVASVDDAGSAKLAMQYEFVQMQRQTNELPPVMFNTNMEAKDIPPEFKNTARDLKGSAPKFWISDLGAALQESDTKEGYQPAARPVAQAGNVIVGDKPAGAAKGDVQQAVAESSATTDNDKKPKESSDGKHVKTGSGNAVTFLMPLPEHAVAVNETWREVIPVNVRVTEEISRKINILRTFRLESVEGGIATISFRSSVEAAVKSPTMRSQLIKATPKGTLTIDIDRGVMLKRDIRYDETVLNAIGQNSVVLCNGSSTEVLMD